MCGICGAITQPNPDVIKSLLIANERRGDKSTGIAYRIGEKTSIFKDTVASSIFVKRISDTHINDSNLVICHTRMPSPGISVSKKNAHPFRYNSIVGVHNGNVSNHSDIKHSGEVDSQAIFHLLSLKKNKFEEVFPELTGSMAVAWVYDGDPNLYLLRHVSPLNMAIHEKTLYFNSEAIVLASTLQAVGCTTPIEELEEDTVYTITPSLDITKTTVTFKPYYTQPTGYGRVGDVDSGKTSLLYPSGERKPYGLAPEYTFPPALPAASTGPGATGDSSIITSVNEEHPWDKEDPEDEAHRVYRGMFNRRGTQAPLRFGTIEDPKGFWSMRQIVEKFHLFKADGSINQKVMHRRARRHLEALLGKSGYELVKDLKDYQSFARTMMDSFGCNVCHFVSHQGFWFVKGNGFVYCNVCATNNDWIRKDGEYIRVK